LTPNERSFYWRLTGRQNLDFFASLYNLKGQDKRTRITEVLFEVGLESESDKPFRLYSSGMRQKLHLARALLSKPDVYLFDEPTVHLDPLAREDMHTFMKRKIVQERKASVLICTHDLTEAQQLADHIVLLHQGKVLAEGSMESLRKRIQYGYRVVLEFEIVPNIDWLRGHSVMQMVEIDNKVEIFIEDISTVPDIVAAAVQGGGRVRKCVHQEKSLEEIFSEITGRGE
jgi:ABC-2 type transport system ATP-binding protein